MKQKPKSSVFSLIVFIAIVTIITSITLVYNYSKKTLYNKGNVSGNTAGNLYNNGLFCEYNDKIYFSNSYDKGEIYVMNSDGSNIKKLYSDTASYLNVSGKYLYYARNNLNADTVDSIFRGNLFGIYRINTNGSNILCLNDETCGVVSLGNNKIFYQHYDTTTALTLRSVSIDGTNEINISKDSIDPSCIEDGAIYYNNVSDDFNLNKMDVGSEQSTLLYEGAFWHPIFDDNYVYFMDLDNDYSLARVNLSTNEKEDLGTGRVDTYNIYGDYVYYQANDVSNPGLHRIKKDGTEDEKIIDGNFSNINVTSKYIYFNPFGNDTPIYKVATTGSLNVTRFDEAADAVEIEN
ncbi:MAG: DUF5050 domain-containing protein [Lachnotalea sp.]